MKHLVSLLLCLGLVLLASVAMATDNPAGTTISKLSTGQTIENNYGTITTLDGGTVVNNYGTIVYYNNGNVTNNKSGGLIQYYQS